MEKFFTVEEANRALALISPIVRDILGKMKDTQKLHDEIKLEKSRADISEADLLKKLSLCEKLLNQVEYHMKELESVGAILKDLKLGLVDFPCLHEERVVYLCWMVGEENVHFWHETDKGFPERKAVDEHFAVEAKI